MTLSAPAEDCLLLLLRMSEREEAITTSALARSLKVADSTVTAMLQRLSGLKLIDYQARRAISLSEAGRLVATTLIRRHRLIESYLCEYLGYSWDEVHAEAERLEHVVSERFIQAINERLGNPKVDPHGEPIPDSTGIARHRKLHGLTLMTVGQSGKLAQIVKPTPEFLAYLTGLGLKIGTVIEVVGAPDEDSVFHVRVMGRDIALGHKAASQILIEENS
jgi:DtxR family Mn-dependent transcriptional regulator